MKWVQFAGREDLHGKSALDLFSSYRLCGKHFEVNLFYNGVSRDRLLPYAVPTLLAVPQPAVVLQSRLKLLGKRPQSPSEVTVAKCLKMSSGENFIEDYNFM